MTGSPAEIVSALAAEAERLETPCGTGRMVWHAWGSGRPVVLLHGGSGSWTHWIRTVPALARGHRVLAADMPGYGDSDLPPEPYGFPTISGAIIDGIRHIVPGGQELDIVGFSLGSFMSHFVATALGARTRNVVLVNGHLVGPFMATPQTMLESWRKIADPEARRETLRRNLAVLMFHDAGRIDDLAMHIYEADVTRARVRPGKFINDRDFTLLERLPGRLTAICGEHDSVAKPDTRAQGAELLRVRPDARFHLIEGAGHWVAYEAADRLNRLLAEVLR